MAKLKNNLPHMAGQSVNVNGTRIQIDSDGIVEISDPLIVDRLLQNKAAWSLVASEEKAATKPKVEAPKRVEAVKVEAPKKVEITTPPKVIVREPIVEEKKEESKKEKLDQVTEDGWADWPDPTPSMSIGYLRQMADAYPSVNYTIKTSKAELIKRIMTAMYDVAEED